MLHYISAKCRCVTRTLMTAEIHALVLGFDHAFVIHYLAPEILECDVPLEAYVDSETVFNVFTKHGKTCGKRLQMDINGLGESYDRREMSKISWIPGHCNSADALKKASHAQKASQLGT